jgi:predicted transcriptional regulator
MTTKLDNELLRELILEAIEDYNVSHDQKAQAVLNKMPVQLASELKQIADLMGVEPARFQELLKNKQELRDLLELIAAETEMRAFSANAMKKQEAFNQKLAKIVKEEFEAVLNEKKKKKKKKSAKDRMKCNSPRRIRKGEAGHGKKKFVVKACDGGTEKIIRYGDANMEIKKDSPKRRKSFRARHNCKNPGSKLKARYWSCKKW